MNITESIAHIAVMYFTTFVKSDMDHTKRSFLQAKRQVCSLQSVFEEYFAGIAQLTCNGHGRFVMKGGMRHSLMFCIG